MRTAVLVEKGMMQNRLALRKAWTTIMARIWGINQEIEEIFRWL
jgi:hypothetical protein